EQDVDRLGRRVDGPAERADPGARVEHEVAAAGELDADARRVAPVPQRARVGHGHRPAHAPEADLHSPTCQKTTSAPWKSPAETSGNALVSTSTIERASVQMWKRP